MSVTFTPVVAPKEWRCELCDQTVAGKGPWCDLYTPMFGKPCLPLAKTWLLQARLAGDLPLSDALADYIRRHWGSGADA